MSEDNRPRGPDLTQGVSAADFADGKLLGHVGDEQVLLVQLGSEIVAIDAFCSHYHGPLAEGLVVGDTVRCPWHHACFSLRNGEAVRPPALTALAVWQVERESDRIFVRHKRDAPQQAAPAPRQAGGLPDRIVIIGGGAAGFAAAEMLRREGFASLITMISDDAAAPVDRPNLSKDYLAGQAPEDWVPLRPDDYYAQAGIELRLNTPVTTIDARERKVVLAGGGSLPFDRLLLATGAEPVRLPIPAASIINPMIELPPTVSPLRVTVTSALKRSTICTNFADARAWRPRLFTMGMSRDTVPEAVEAPEAPPEDTASSGPPVIFRRGPGWR